jgi:hypothetical protein
MVYLQTAIISVGIGFAGGWITGKSLLSFLF